MTLSVSRKRVWRLRLPARLVVWLLVAVLLPHTASAQAPVLDVGPAPQSLEDLQTRIQEVMAAHHVPGLGLALVTPDGRLASYAWGMADVAASTPATVDTLFRFGSVSKSFVALAALKLQEEGRLDLNALVSDLAPEVVFDNPWAATAPVRVVHLIEHTAGLDDMLPREYAADNPAISTLESVQFLGKARPVRWPPGRYTSYSNTGPAIAAYLVEKIAGQRFEDYVAEQFFAPLDMPTASYFLTDAVAAALAKSYRGDGVTPVPYSHIILRPSGAVSATPRDMGRLVQLLINRGSLDGVTLLSPDSVTRMETPQSSLAAQAGVPLGYALANFTTMDWGFVFQGHNGGIDGYLAAYAYLPEARVGYAFAINQASGEASERIERLIRGYLTRDLTPPTPQPAGPDVAPLQAVRYYAPLTSRQEFLQFIMRLGNVVALMPSSDGLLLRPLLGGPPATLVRVSPTLARLAQDPLPSVAFLTVDGDEVMTGAAGHYKQIAAWDAWLRLGSLAGAQIILLSSVLLVILWLPLAFWRRPRRLAVFALYFLPALAVACLLLAVVPLFSSSDVMRTIGTANAASVATWLLLWLFVVVSLAALVQVVRGRRLPVNRLGWLHAGLVAVTCVLLAGYMLVWGVIGLSPWLW